MATCPVCSTTLVKEETQEERYFYECPRCGPYSLSGSAMRAIATQLRLRPDAPAIVSHALYQMSSREQWAMMTEELLINVVRNSFLPSHREQLDNFILWMGEKQPTPGGYLNVSGQMISAIGALDEKSAGFVVEYAIDRGLVTGKVLGSMDGPVFGPLVLSFNGWTYLEELRRGQSSSRIAVMAMKYGDPALDAIVRDHFRPAVASTGFELKRIDEGQQAGLIDDRMRVEIRQSRFLVADLSHENNGAYWEAGYAEGLGKPVIYTCRKDVHEKAGTHFDTNHHLTVVWDPENIGEALEKLKATIRATLPEEAKLND